MEKENLIKVLKEVLVSGKIPESDRELIRNLLVKLEGGTFATSREEYLEIAVKIIEVLAILSTVAGGG